MRILVIDDSSTARIVLSMAIKKAGVKGEIAQAPDGRDGLRQILESAPSLIFCDLHMPDMSGIDVLREARERGIDVPFTFVTSDPCDEVREAAESNGTVFILRKPVAESELATCLRLGGAL